jgi:hypothetical protein
VTTLVIDESGDDISGRQRYVIGAGVFLNSVAFVRAEIAALFVSRRRPFHWVAEGSVTRHAMLDLIGALGIEVFAVVGAAESRHHIELVRERCLRELFRITRPLAPSSVIIESRERSTGIVGQNRRDYATLIEARHAGELAPSVHYEWAPKTDPLVWLADTVAGAVLGAERGDASWIDRLGQRTRLHVVRLPPERA